MRMIPDTSLASRVITVPTIQYGGYFLLTSLMNKRCPRDDYLAWAVACLFGYFWFGARGVGGQTGTMNHFSAKRTDQESARIMATIAGN